MSIIDDTAAKLAWKSTLEDAEQVKLVEWMDARGLRFSYLPLGKFKLTGAQAKRLKQLGVRPGVPDMMIIVGCRLLFIELKAPHPHRSKVSDEQDEWRYRLSHAGVHATVCWGWLDAATYITALAESQNVKLEITGRAGPGVTRGDGPKRRSPSREGATHSVTPRTARKPRKTV